MIFFKFPFGPLATNSILVYCQKAKKGAVIDPAMGSKEALLGLAKEKGIVIEKVLFTHSHWDHFADAHALISATKAESYVHGLDAKNLEEPGSDGIPMFFPIRGVKPDHLLNEGDEVWVGECKLEVIHTPGHSPGGVCFYAREENVLFSGDTLFQGTLGSLQLPTAQPLKMWESLRKLAALPPETRVVPGHGGETSIGEENWLARARELFE